MTVKNALYTNAPVRGKQAPRPPYGCELPEHRTEIHVCLAGHVISRIGGGN